jgi:hypothetical protein
MNESTEALKVELVNPKTKQDEILSALITSGITLVVSTAGTLLAQHLVERKMRKTAEAQKVAQKTEQES